MASRTLGALSVATYLLIGAGLLAPLAVYESHPLPLEGDTSFRLCHVLRREPDTLELDWLVPSIEQITARPAYDGTTAAYVCILLSLAGTVLLVRPRWLWITGAAYLGAFAWLFLAGGFHDPIVFLVPRQGRVDLNVGWGWAVALAAGLGMITTSMVARRLPGPD